MKKPTNKQNNSARAKKLGEKRQKRAKVAHQKKLQKKEELRIEKLKKEQEFNQYMNNLMGK